MMPRLLSSTTQEGDITEMENTGQSRLGRQMSKGK